MKTVSVKIKGTSPLLMHRFPIEQVEGIEKKTKEEQAEYSSYRMDNKNLYIPAICIQRALISSATYSKGKGRSSLQRSAAACISVDPQYLDLGITEYKVDSRAVVVPATKGRIVRHRPRIDEWSVDFELTYDQTLLKESEVKKILDDCGLRVGLLDFRPEKKGPFGKFIVTRFDV